MDFTTALMANQHDYRVWIMNLLRKEMGGSGRRKTETTGIIQNKFWTTGITSKQDFRDYNYIRHVVYKITSLCSYLQI